MRKRWVVMALAPLVAVTAVVFAPQPWAGAAPPARLGPGEQLRYLGRDPLTGMPAAVNDRFIAEVEQSIARYGKDESEAVPPPPAAGIDLVRIQAPAIGVDAPVARYGLDRFGRLDVPQDTTTVGWNPAFSSLPGEGKSTFLAAHFQFGGRPGVFNRLSKLTAGDQVALTLSDGSTLRYRVTSVIDYALGTIDMGALLAGREGVESITLMTCSGPLNEGEFQLRTVVLAERISDGSEATVAASAH